MDLEKEVAQSAKQIIHLAQSHKGASVALLVALVLFVIFLIIRTEEKRQLREYSASNIDNHEQVEDYHEHY